MTISSLKSHDVLRHLDPADEGHQVNDEIHCQVSEGGVQAQQGVSFHPQSKLFMSFDRFNKRETVLSLTSVNVSLHGVFTISSKCSLFIRCTFVGLCNN